MLVCWIVPGVDHPERRRFDGPPFKEWVIANRSEVAVAHLTLTRSYVAAGEPRPDVAEFGSFELWCRLVRYPLMHAGFADPCLTLAAIEESDPVSSNLRGLLRAWREEFGSQSVTVKEALESRSSSLQEAMAFLVRPGKDGKISNRHLGNYLRDRRQRVEDGLFFEACGGRQGSALWCVRSVSPT